MTVGSRSIRMMAILFVFNSILAAVALFVFYAVPAIYFILLYTEGRKEVRARKVARSVRVRQTKTQQRVQSNLQQRYESPLQKQEPIVYMPNRRTSSRNSSVMNATPATERMPISVASVGSAPVRK